MGQEQGIAFQKEEGLYWRGKKWNNYSVLAVYSFQIGGFFPTQFFIDVSLNENLIENLIENVLNLFEEINFGREHWFHEWNRA